MKKLLSLLSIILLCTSCGIIEDTEEEKFKYVYVLKNETGQDVQITNDTDSSTQTILNNFSYECSYTIPESFVGGLCGNFVEIRISNTNMGFRCHRAISDFENLCFIDDERVFTRLEGTIFTEIDTRVYEYVLTPELLEGAFELPD
ncbi:hypothetical protein M3P19_00185 [Muricauda sp. 2012CJ35-5]|uniref:Lipoprotein n=1 Tax=Flagellimonas spongiicola TaxID=2942208 RepID=A0ABT0PLZ2_9FLAO|nr:hypothetical protein [Allomuricauda spongiicola]MCL6272400.1 hypothetical protein [Allomuricauda spongiicola]